MRRKRRLVWLVSRPVGVALQTGWKAPTINNIKCAKAAERSSQAIRHRYQIDDWTETIQTNHLYSNIIGSFSNPIKIQLVYSTTCKYQRAQFLSSLHQIQRKGAPPTFRILTVCVVTLAERESECQKSPTSRCKGIEKTELPMANKKRLNGWVVLRPRRLASSTHSIHPASPSTSPYITIFCFRKRPMNEKEEEIVHFHPASKKASKKKKTLVSSLPSSPTHSRRLKITSKEYPAPQRLRFVHVTIRFDLRDEGKATSRTDHSPPRKK